MSSNGHPNEENEALPADAAGDEVPGADADKPEQAPPVPHLLFCGSNKWDLIGRNSVPKSVLERGGSDAGEEMLAPTRLQFNSLPAVRFRSVFSGPCASHLVLVDHDGPAYGLGRNDSAQLGCADQISRSIPVRFELPGEAQGVKSAACGRAHTIIVTEDGRCYTIGLNGTGQLGNADMPQSTFHYESTWQTVALPSDERVVSVAAGADFSIFACESGVIYAAGYGQYGQLGNGRTGEHIESKNRISFDIVAKPARVMFPSNDISIKQVAAGTNHVLALDSAGKVWSWGFGGYGRLGHRSPKDELRPRLIDAFDAPHYKIDYVTCGSTSSFAVQRSRGATFFWGLTKKTGESNMYPKPMFDLQGNDMHCLVSGPTSTVAASQKCVVAWGASPTFGELGFGEGNPKSSTKPRVLEDIEGLYCRCIAEGVAFTAMIVQVGTEEEEEILGKLNVNKITEGSTGEKRKASESKATPKRVGKAKKRKKAR